MGDRRGLEHCLVWKTHTLGVRVSCVQKKRLFPSPPPLFWAAPSYLALQELGAAPPPPLCRAHLGALRDRSAPRAPPSLSGLSMVSVWGEGKVQGQSRSWAQRA